jgi:hypothetical protein
MGEILLDSFGFLLFSQIPAVFSAAFPPASSNSKRSRTLGGYLRRGAPRTSAFPLFLRLQFHYLLHVIQGRKYHVICRWKCTFCHWEYLRVSCRAWFKIGLEGGQRSVQRGPVCCMCHTPLPELFQLLFEQSPSFWTTVSNLAGQISSTGPEVVSVVALVFLFFSLLTHTLLSTPTRTHTALNSPIPYAIVLSVTAQHCLVLQVEYMPALVFPFVRLFGTDAVAAFEASVVLVMNFCQV